MPIHHAQTRFGMVAGVAAGNPAVAVFRGIPYAAPPVGELRWCPPQPPLPWEGVRRASEFSGICPQNLDLTGSNSKEAPPPFEPMSEDCLYLNIWTPAEAPDERLPVLFWIHGGANVTGYGHMPQFDGEGLAGRGIILVTFNWRVNIFGWLVHRELSAESERGISGNYALLDQIAALTWVRENIAAFGGDADNITVAGESAGGSSTQLMCMTPLTRDLFRNAIMQSGGGFDLFSSAAMGTLEEEERRVDLERALGVSNIAEARKLDAMEIIRRISRLEAAGAYIPMPVADGYVMPGTMKEIALENRYHKVNYIIGYTEDEAGMYDMPADREWFLQEQRAEYGALADQYLRLCRFLEDDDAFRAHIKGRSAELLKTGALVWADLLESHGNQTPYVYCFTRQMPGDNAGAYHSAELWYQFETLNRNWRPFTGADYELSARMAGLWANFIKTGDPNGAGLPRWERYTQARPLTMDLGLDMRMKDFSANARVEFRRDYVLGRL